MSLLSLLPLLLAARGAPSVSGKQLDVVPASELNDHEDDAEAIRCVTIGLDSFGKPLPIPPSVYEKIQSETARPLLAMMLWNVETANSVPCNSPHAAAT